MDDRSVAVRGETELVNDYGSTGVVVRTPRAYYERSVSQVLGLREPAKNRCAINALSPKHRVIIEVTEQLPGRTASIHSTNGLYGFTSETARTDYDQVPARCQAHGTFTGDGDAAAG